MKRIAFYLIPILAIVSCSKELETNDSVVEGKTVVVDASIDNSETKTNYAISGNTATFCWSGAEQIGRLTWGGSMSQTIYDSTTEANSGETELSFQGNEVTGDTGYAIYPPKGARAGFNWYSNPFCLYLDESISYDSADPLKGIVPMMGKLDASGKYVFKPITGVIGIRMTHIPATATKITISSSTTKLSLGFRNSAQTETVTYSDELEAIYEGGLLLSSARNDAANTKSYTFSAGSLDFDTEYTFYYPIPVGTITGGLTVTVYAGTAEIISKSSTADLVVKKATITRLPLITLPTVIENWTSMGTGKFIDTYVWADQGLGTAPVEVEFFESDIDGRYRMANPYAAAATAAGKTVTGADDYFYFTLGEKGRVTYEWLNMGIPMSQNPAKNWAMIDGYSVAGWDSGYAHSHVVSYNADGSLANIQLAPCYRTSDENKTGGPSSYDNSIGKDSSNGIIEIAFPGKDILMPYTITSSMISVSANHSGDGTGSAGLIDDDLTSWWHSPWSGTAACDPIYGVYADVNLKDNPGLNQFAFSYCTRNTTDLRGMPKKVVVGVSKNGLVFKKLGEYELDCMNNVTGQTWVGLPVVDATNYAYLRFGIVTNHNNQSLTTITNTGNQFIHLGELMVFGVSSGSTAVWEAAPSPEALTITEDMITVNSDAGNKAGTSWYDGAGKQALVDGNVETFWHSAYSAAEGYSSYYQPSIDYDPTYGVTIDISLSEDLQAFHLSYNTRHNNNNGRPREIKFAGSNNGTDWTYIATVSNYDMVNAAAGGLVELATINAGSPYRYLRIGITQSGSGNSLTVPYYQTDGKPDMIGSTALGEIYLYNDAPTPGSLPVSAQPTYGNGGVINW